LVDREHARGHARLGRLELVRGAPAVARRGLSFLQLGRRAEHGARARRE
jgi:hypothetical protein